MEDVLDAAVDRTGSRLDVPRVTTLFGAKTRPRTARGRRPPRLEVAIETPAYDLTKFKVHFGNLTLKGYTKGERVLRFEASPATPKTCAAARRWRSSRPSSPPSGRWWRISPRPSPPSMPPPSPPPSPIPSPPP